jgi:DNA (cytosine-5)-methyltransferase 1
MSASVYYNEIDPYCAAWLQNLMDAGHIPAGVIDTRSIEDVRPDELRGYTQCHFFAGLGGWAYALQLAGWGTRPVWTGSCPCQPFSAAGKGAGFADERHLWPAWFHLISQCRPEHVFGEQVASKDGLAWWDLVHDDMEGQGYAITTKDICSASATDTDIRQRLYWVADTGSAGLAQRESFGRVQCSAIRPFEGKAIIGSGASLGLGDTTRERRGEARTVGSRYSQRLADASPTRRLGDAELSAQARQREHGWEVVSQQEATRLGLPGRLGSIARPVEWIACADGFYRPVEPGSFPLAHGLPGRVGRLRAYGNAINAEVATAFIESYCEARGLIDEQIEVAA